MENIENYKLHKELAEFSLNTPLTKESFLKFLDEYYSLRKVKTEKEWIDDLYRNMSPATYNLFQDLLKQEFERLNPKTFYR